jgi:hypothetical protein
MDIRDKFIDGKKENKFSLPFLHPNIVHGEGEITSDAIGSLCADENNVQSDKYQHKRKNKGDVVLTSIKRCYFCKQYPKQINSLQLLIPLKTI